MAVENEDKSWIAELQSALNEEGIGQDGDEDIYHGKIIPDSLRPEVWKNLLAVREQHFYLDDIFDLPEQNVIRQDCQEFVAKLGNAEEDKVSVLSDLESILTAQCKACGKPYKQGNGWLDILKVIIPLRLDRQEALALLQAIVDRYTVRDDAVYPLFRLLVQYHDPGLCSLLDTKRTSPEVYASVWFSSLFAATCSLPVTSALWDLHFQQSDPFFLLFLGLVLLLNSRDALMSLADETKERVLDVLKNLPSGLEVDDVEDLCGLAQYYSSKTPASFRQDSESAIFDDDCGSLVCGLAQSLCLPVSVRELVDSLNQPTVDQLDDADTMRFFLVDCRPSDQYNSGHLPTAFHLDPYLMLQGGEVWSTAVAGLLSSQAQALQARSIAAGDHLCFMGCGRDDRYTHMVVASFLRNNTHYVSILSGGYQALHEYFPDGIDNVLSEHNRASCLVCAASRQPDDNINTPPSRSPSKDLFGKIGAAVKSKSAEVKEKLMEYIVNGSAGAEPAERHVSASDRITKRYRNMAPIFSIDDNDADTPELEEEERDEPDYEVVTLSQWLKKPDLVASFPCQELKMNGQTYNSYLLVFGSDVVILRNGTLNGIPGDARVVSRRPLSSIAKITCKKKRPQLITFKYCSPTQTNVISDMDRFIIPKAKEATTVISNQIVKLLKDSQPPAEIE